MLPSRHAKASVSALSAALEGTAKPGDFHCTPPISLVAVEFSRFSPQLSRPQSKNAFYAHDAGWDDQRILRTVAAALKRLLFLGELSTGRVFRFGSFTNSLSIPH
jgi:hypothetical protein